MDDPYRIEVLHIVNPHVLFVESQARKGVPVIQQIGIYGILPVNKTVDIDGQVVAERCENWPVAANTILREFLTDHNNGIYFVPIQVEKRSTIFDEKTYQFGDIIVKSRKRTSVTDHLIKLAVAEKDDGVFQEKLTTGSLKIKLNSIRTEEVLNAIKRYYQKQKKVEHDWQKTINKQTCLYQESKKISSDLTEKNLKMFEKHSDSMKNVFTTIERKEKDLDLCKDADVVGIGCGSRRSRSRNSTSKVKKICGDNEKDDFKPDSVLNNMKNFFETHGIAKDKTDYNNFKNECKDGHEQSTPAKKIIHNHDNIPTSKNQEKITHDKLHHKFKNKQTEASHEIYINQNEKENVCHINNSLYQSHEISKLKYDSEDADEEIPYRKYCSQRERHEKTRQKNYSDDKNKNITAETNLSKGENMETKIEHKFHENSPQKGPTEDDYWDSPDQNYNDKLEIAKNQNELLNIDDSGNNTFENRMDSSYTGEKVSRGGTKKTPPSKPRERLRVYCPDMEMSNNNLKNLVPTKVIEEYASDYSKTPSTQNVDTKLDVDYVDDVESKVDPKTNYLDRLKKLATKKSVDQTDCQTKSKNENIILQNKATQKEHSKSQDTSKTNSEHRLVSSILRKKLQALKQSQQKQLNNSISSNSDTSAKDESSSTGQSKTEPEQTNIELEKPQIEQENLKLSQNITRVERNVNPFKNLDGSKSVFVEKLVTPILMVHTKNDNLVLPQCELRDIPFKTDIHIMLKNMRVYKPKRLQSVSWSYILRGHSVFMVSAAGNGKTLGYVPAVCNIVSDSMSDVVGVGPFCVIVCATALSLSEVETCCKRFLGLEERIVSCYPGVDPTDVTTALLNGCHILICTAPMLVSLLEVDFGVDLRRLTVLVFDDCERLSEVYSSELNKILQHVKVMLKNRADKSLKVQYVVASRQWCDFMTPLAKKAPDTIIAIGASQECVLYSKTNTSVNFVKNQDSKVKALVGFLQEIDSSKRTVITCRDDDEVVLLEKELTKLKHTVFACNSTMTLHDLYQLNEAWGSYQEPVLGPILVCCDGNLTHLNITNANYLVHFSMPALFSMFCKRFSVLNENYASIFRDENENVKIKIFLDENNVEQLPKILNFVKRCTKESFPMLDNVLQEVLKDKDLKKAEIMVPICNNLLMLGECIDMSHCPDRHTVFDHIDEPKDWMPRQGIITFKITHVDTAVTYSARVLSKLTKEGITKYPNNYYTLSLKMGMYYSKEVNRKLHGKPKVGDICAVAVKQNFFERCQVMKVIPNDSRKSDHVLINLIDKEQLTITTDVHLYYLPDEFKIIETHMVKIRLANIQPKDKDVTFSVAAKNLVRSIVEHDSENVPYMRGRVVMTLGKTIFVDTAEACLDLSSFGETVVSRDLRKELLNRHAEPNPQHIDKLIQLGGMISPIDEKELKITSKVQKRQKWAHLEKGDFSTVFLSTAIDASTMFVRLAKFQKVIDLLHNDIKMYVENTPELDLEEIYVGNIILAEYPDDKTYERARIDSVMDENKVKCFFVDHGDWRQVPKDKLRPITDNILHRIPFQAIECRLVGVKPPGDADAWPEFTTCWLEDFCYEDSDGNAKYLFLKYFTKEEAKITGGHKYGVVIFDTSTDQDIVINKKMIDLNLAKENKDESKYIDEPLVVKPVKVTDSSDDAETSIDNSIETTRIKDLVPLPPIEQFKNNDSNQRARNILFEKPIRSIPLVNDSDSDDFDKWDVNVDKDLLGMFGQPSKANVTEYNSDTDSTDKEKCTSYDKEMKETKPETNKNINEDADSSTNKSKVSCSSTRVSQIENSKEIAELIAKSPMLESQSDSDDIDIGTERIAALNVFKRKFICKDITEIALKNTDLVKSKTKELFDSVKQKKNDTLDSDDLSSIASEAQNTEAIVANVPKVAEIDPNRKPKLVWRQNKNSITLKIILIGVEDYILDIKERSLRFNTWHNDTTYEFDIVLYGVVNPQKSQHSNKGQYIQVNLLKMLQRNWLNLTKDCSAKKWIVYDVDAIGFSTDEEEENNDALKAIKQNHDKVESESEDEDFHDDLNIGYKRHL